MNLLALWWHGLTRPRQAFAEIKSKPAPQWGFWSVLIFNLLISLTTLLSLYLLGKPPLMESALTFLPNEQYLLAEMFFLPPLRMLVWLMASGVIHLGLRLAGQKSDYDQILNIGGLGYLVVMPVILVTDWLFIACDCYEVVLYTHPLSTVWSVALTAIGLKRLLGVKTGLALTMGILSAVISIPLLALLAR